jgi:hypothetical protein
MYASRDIDVERASQGAVTFARFQGPNYVQYHFSHIGTDGAESWQRTSNETTNEILDEKRVLLEVSQTIGS